jgi:hypothetical protein
MYPCVKDIYKTFDASDPRATICCEGPGGCGCPKGKQCCTIGRDPTGPVFGCVNLKTEEKHCGACDNPCPDGETCEQGKCVNTKCGGSGGVKCSPGQECCKGKCVDKGKCVGTKCGPNGVSCPPDKPSCCEGVCVNLNVGVRLTYDEPVRHCGRCGTTCPQGTTCGLSVHRGITCPNPVDGVCSPGMCCFCGAGCNCEQPT